MGGSLAQLCAISLGDTISNGVKVLFILFTLSIVIYILFGIIKVINHSRRKQAKKTKAFAKKFILRVSLLLGLLIVLYIAANLMIGYLMYNDFSHFPVSPDLHYISSKDC